MSPGRPSSVLPSLLLLSLVATVKAGIPVPRNPGCTTPTEGKNYLQNVKVNLSILNPLTPNVNSRRSSDYYKRSTSPWTLRRNEDPERYPSVIWEAECRYSGCINADGKENHLMSSVPIQQETLVLRREPQNCPLSFRLEKMRVTVGCTCVSPVVHHVG
ncbi:PREDICTED: interleukin-17A [Chinchilla lanigera]|uniref:Interleukin 17A n=1 Tax=Chinchilla lanigera TaxID=34839 RepID=A0A8C2YRH2_CHILA|nr:PREDICTED: interleukin-17A [Chinchilla lanigera]